MSAVRCADHGWRIVFEEETKDGWWFRDSRRHTGERGMRFEVLTLQDLIAWSLPGTVITIVEKALRNAGFRVTPNAALRVLRVK
jgi:hypothetical protein